MRDFGEERRERDVEVEVDENWGSDPGFKVKVAKFCGRDLTKLGD